MIRRMLFPIAISLSAQALTGQASKEASATVEVLGHLQIPEAAAYEIPKLAERATAVENIEFQVAHLKLDLKKGVACPIYVGDQMAGLYFKGDGSFRYTEKDLPMEALVRSNLKATTNLIPEDCPGGFSFGESVKEAIIWMSGQSLPALPMATLPAPEDTFASAVHHFAVGTRGEPTRAENLATCIPLGQLMTYRTYQTPSQPTVVADLISDGRHYTYRFDRSRSRLETLMLQSASTDGAVPLTVLLGSSPLGWTRQAPPDPDFRLAHLDIDLKASTHVTANLKIVETIQVIRPGLRVLSFRYRDGLEGSGAMGQAKRQRAVVSKVSVDGGADLPYDLRGGFLMVDLGQAAKNGETIKLRFEMEGPLLPRQGNDSYWRLGPGEAWFPEPDMAGQSYTVKAHIAVEKPFMAIASAKTVLRSADDKYNILEARLDKPTLWFSVDAGRYESKEMVRNGRIVRAWGYSGLGHGVEPLLKTVHGILDFYDALFGDVPYDEINLVEVPELGHGQAPPGMIWLTREAFDAIGDDLNRLVAANGAVGGWVNRMIAHELAHQYWGHQVKMWGYEDQWLTESFAEYTSGLAMRAMKRKGQPVFDAIIRDWRSKAEVSTKVSSIPACNFLAENAAFSGRDRQALMYYKGAYLLACLHHELGEEKFATFFRAYQKKFAWYPPSYDEDIPGLLKAVTGKDYEPWMDRYFWSTGLPDWKP